MLKNPATPNTHGHLATDEWDKGDGFKKKYPPKIGIALVTDER
jgi:hypothetical protein